MDSVESQDPETIAKAYLAQALASDSARGFAAPVVDQVASEFKSVGSESIPLTGTTAVRFRQTLNKIPVYGSLVTVELDEENQLLGINSAIGSPEGISPLAKISTAEAVRAVAQHRDYKAALENIVPRLNYFYDVAKGKWHLAFILEDVPVVRGTAKGRVPVKVDYVVDAQKGKVIAILPRTPTVAATAVDCLGVSRTFGVEQSGGSKVLRDTLLNVQTFDFKKKDPETQFNLLPGTLIKNPPAFSPSAVSAHANASDVSQFMRTTLMRNNIDGVGGAMVSSINCIQVSESVGGLGKEWINAFWDGTQMVYGLRFKSDGTALSLAADLDVVAHEMTHGVTDRSSRLEYRLQSGALNESYSDIFGVIVNNFRKPDQSTWNWEIGAGLLPNGSPFRDFSNPPARGQPDHMRDFVVTPRDHGGVHTNSGIHNKAAHNVLVSKTASGAFVFTPREAAVIFYLALTQQLRPTSQFVDSRNAVLQSARTFFRALPPAQLAGRITAIGDAYSAVGIT
ncbi:MAG: M4 family metallopeptidase [Planctomycetia bacterium]|nr:M4 family metallopeptidase [Planctomycetia bacterium]